jgi:hypothetical protein
MKLLQNMELQSNAFNIFVLELAQRRWGLILDRCEELSHNMKNQSTWKLSKKGTLKQQHGLESSTNVEELNNLKQLSYNVKG